MGVLVQFPTKADDAERLARLASNLQRAVPLASTSVELQRLLCEGAALVEQMDDARLDQWLADLEAWENRSIA